LNQAIGLRRFLQSAGKSAAVFFLLLPPAAFFWTVLRFSSNRPFSDDYDAVLAFMNQFLSAPWQIRLWMLPAQHNEHRIVLSRIITLADYFITGRINFVTLNLIGNLGVIAIFVIVAMSMPRKKMGVAALVPISFLCFNFAQWALMYFPMAALQQYWQTAFALASLSVLATVAGARGIAGATALGVIASFTGGGGLLVFPVGLFAFAAQRRWRGLFSWLAISAAVFFVYFVALHFELPSGSSKSATLSDHHPVEWLLYAWAFIGNSLFFVSNATGVVFLVSNSGDVAIVAGALFMVLVAFSSIPMLVKGQTPEAETEGMHTERLRPVLFGLFILAAAVAAGHARLAESGVMQSLTPRYGIYGLLALAISYQLWLSLAPRRHEVFIKGTFIMASVCLFGYAYHPGRVQLEARKEAALHTIAYPKDRLARAKNILRVSAQNGVYVLPPANNTK